MKICIVAAAPSSLALAPYGDKDWEIWGCASQVRELPRLDVVFEVHNLNREDQVDPEHISFLERFKGLVWTMAEYPNIPGCEVLPYKALMKKYSPYFFTSTVAWMFAMALEVADEISLYGIDMAADTEYYDQRMGLQFFATVAKKKGIKVTVPPQSDVLRPLPLYGLREYNHSWIKQTARERDLKRRLDTADDNLSKDSLERQFYKGASNNQDYEMKTWFGSNEYIGAECCTVPKIDL